MSSVLRASFVLLALVACSSPPAPAATAVDVAPVSAATASPAPPADAPRRTTIAGSTWHFCDKANETVTFEADGAATFRKDGQLNAWGLNCGDAHWKQDGTSLVFDCARFTQYTVTVAPDEMRGQWKRLEGSQEGAATCLQRDK